MFKFWHVFRFVGFIILLGLLVLGGIGLFNAGWAQGAMAASAPAATTTVPAAPYAYGYGMHPYGFHPGFFGFAFGLIPAFFLILLVFLGLRLLFFHPFMGHGFRGRQFENCGPYGHFHHHMGPPDPQTYEKWYQEWTKYRQEGNHPEEKSGEAPKTGE